MSHDLPTPRPVPLITHWRIANGIIRGTMIRHPRLTGEQPVPYPIARDGDTLITPHGDRYELGEADPTYEAEQPNARARVMASVNEVPVTAGRVA